MAATVSEHPTFNVTGISKTDHIVLAKAIHGPFSYCDDGVIVASSVYMEGKFPPSERKLFPFHYYGNFRTHKTINGVITHIPELHCDYCGVQEVSGNGSYYMGYMVMEKPDELKFCCEECQPPSNSLDWFDQKYGFKEPIVLPAKFQGSDLHKFVFFYFMKSRGYCLRKFPKGISLKEWNDEVSDRLKNSARYGSYGGDINVDKHGAKIKVTFKGNRALSKEYTPKEIIDIVNEILLNQPSEATTAEAPQTKPSTNGWVTVFKYKSNAEKFNCVVKVGSYNGSFAYQWNYHFLQGEGGSIGEAKTSKFEYTSLEHAKHAAVSAMHTDLLTNHHGFRNDNWLKKFSPSLPRYRNVLPGTNEEGIIPTEPAALPATTAQPLKIRQVDGLQQIELPLEVETKQVQPTHNPDAHLFGYIATDKTDRQRFGRKMNALLDKLKELPAAERNALIKAVNAKFPPPLTGVNGENIDVNN